MGKLSSFGGEPVTTSYVGAFTSSTSLHSASLPGLAVNSGALTADTYPTNPQVEITGAGVLELAYYYLGDTTSRTVTAKVVIDGTTIVENSRSGTTTGFGSCLVGFVQGTPLVAASGVAFKQSMKIFLKSSLTETDKCVIKYVARVQ